MSVIALTPQNFDVMSLQTHPSRSFSSGSNTGVTGSVYVYPLRSKNMKDAEVTIGDQELPFGEGNLHNLLDILNAFISANGIDTTLDFTPVLEAYLEVAGKMGMQEKMQQVVEINNVRPTPYFSTATLAKNSFKKSLYPYYKTNYHNLNWAYTNYNCLNFFTSSLNRAHGFNDVDLSASPTNGTALIYPAPTMSIHSFDPYPGFDFMDMGVLAIQDALLKGPVAPYRPTGSFTFEFWINPRYNHLDSSGEFPAGTIMHMSSCYALSLVTGSERDLQDNPSRFKLLLQLSHSAEIAPSDVALGLANNNPDDAARAFPRDLIFETTASLKHNHWHHVAITWGPDTNSRYGRFYIDGKQDSEFLVNSASIFDQTFPGAASGNGGVQSEPDALFIGNFYDGANNSVDSNQIAQFFNSNAVRREGLYDFESLPAAVPGTFTTDPPTFNFRHDLQAELHDLRIWEGVRSQQQVQDIKDLGLSYYMVQKLGTEKFRKELMFYLPVFFTKETRRRNVLITPFVTTGEVMEVPGSTAKFDVSSTSTINPFNARLAFTTNCHQINLPNFLREFCMRSWPRLYNLTASLRSSELYPESNYPANLFRADGFGTELHTTTLAPVSSLLGGGKPTANQNRTEKERACKANLLLLPNDNGQFRPNFNLLVSGSTPIINAFKGPDSLTNPTWVVPDPKLTYDNQLYMVSSGSILDKFVGDNGALDFSLINLNDIMAGKSVSSLAGVVLQDVTKVQNIMDWISMFSQATPMYPAQPPIAFLQLPSMLLGSEGEGVNTSYVWTELQDPSSNMVGFFIIPQLYYGDRIHPKSMRLKGVLGVVKTHDDDIFKTPLNVTLKDNGAGNLYRADSFTPHAKWNNVGDILYEEGFLIIKSPHLYTLGIQDANRQMHESLGIQTPAGDAYSLEFQGSRNIHVLEIMIPVPAPLLNSSSNPTYEHLLPSDHINDKNSDFVYLTGMNFHDDNFNVIARTNLAQPVIKREGDKLFFRVKIDF